jgi:hypothetical protein
MSIVRIHTNITNGISIVQKVFKRDIKWCCRLDDTFYSNHFFVSSDNDDENSRCVEYFL